MKLAVLCMLVILLTGCGGENTQLNRAMELRAQLLGHRCSFEAEVTADYGEQVHSFSVYCEGDQQGSLGFRITQPETVAGITGVISGGTGKLTYGETALAFPLLADGQVTPVSAPWLLLKTLQGGYLASAGMEGDYLRLTVYDSYEDGALMLDIWLDGENRPVRGDILYDGRRILALTVTEFQIL